MAEALGSPGPVVAFAHGHILRAVACAFLGWEVTAGAQLGLDTAALGVLRDGERGRLLQAWNLTG